MLIKTEKENRIYQLKDRSDFLILIRRNNLVVRPKKSLLVPRSSYFSQKVVVRHNYLHGIFPLHNFVAGNRTDTAVSPSIQIH